MSILDRFRKKQTKDRLKTLSKAASADAPKKKAEAEKAVSAPAAEKHEPAEKKEQHEKKAKTPKIASERVYRSIVRPLITEKAISGTSTYFFAVDPHTNKQEIKKAITELYGVTPVAVRVQNRIGKAVRYGRHHGRLKDWKKAIVALKPGETIEINEGV